MPKRLHPKKIHQACLLHFRGETLTDIARLLAVTPSTLSRWRKTEIWHAYETKLLDEMHQENKANEKKERDNAKLTITDTCHSDA